MALAAGTRLGHYEILSELGAGGMGTVYKARDTRLDRLLAIKVLKEHTPDFRVRFDQEARVIAALQHPHICTLHDIGADGGVEYLVMEYLDGHVLHCPQSLAKTLEYGSQIAGALDAAHRQGLAHRDVKPSNIMITKAGAKLLDFGIAKRDRAHRGAVPETTESITSPGTIIGSLNYMAPERLEGHEADARSDVWSFGAVLYEMVTGQRAFGGTSAARVIAAVLDHQPPDITSIQKLAPLALERLIRRCLAKDPEDRWQSMRDVKLELESIAGPGEPGAAPRRWFRVGLAGSAALALAAGSWLLRPAPREPLQVNITSPPNTRFARPQIGVGGSAVSPDGTMLAFVAKTERSFQLWVRRLDRLEARALPETNNAHYPFWSPDSRWIGFFAGTDLKKIAVTGGPPQRICFARSARGGTWSARGVILFSAESTEKAIFQVSAAGGTPAPLTKLVEQDYAHYWPHFLPDGNKFLYLNRSTQPGMTAIVAASLDGPGQRRLVGLAQSSAAYASGYVLFVHERTLMARPFDESRLAPTGEAFPLAEPVASASGSHPAEFSVSGNGVLVYGAGGGAQNRLVWRDRHGVEQARVGSEGNYVSPRLSPDGRRLAFGRELGNNWDIWEAESQRGALTRVTSDAAYEGNPTWSPQGETLTFGSLKSIYQRSVNGSEQSSQLTSRKLPPYPQDWSTDGRYLLFSEVDEKTSHDIMIFEPATGKTSAFLRTQFSERHPQFQMSAGTRWIAYASNEAGPLQIYLQSFSPGQGSGGARQQVSIDGGTMPRWRRDGKELYFLSSDGKLMAATVRLAGGTAQVSKLAPLFPTSASGNSEKDWSYDVTGDGERFLMVEPVEDTDARSLTLFTNWLAGARR